MTTTHATGASITDLLPPVPALTPLRAVLYVNSVSSFACGSIGLLAAGRLSDELGFDHVALTRVVSVALMLFAVDVALVARSRPDRLLALTPLVSAADLAWVAATAVVVGSGALTVAGAVVAVIIGVAVLGFGVAQLWFRRAVGPATGRVLSPDAP